MKTKNLLFFFYSLCCLNLIFGFINYIEFHLFWIDGDGFPPLILAINIAFCISFIITLHYKLSANFNIFQIIFNVFELCLFFCLFTLIYWYSVEMPLHRPFALFLFFLFFILSKIILDRIFVYFLRKKEIAINHSDSILIGYNDYSQNLINEIDKNKYLGYTILNKYPNADNISEIIEYISNNNIKSVFVNTDMLQFNNGLESKMRELSENSFVKFYSISELYSSKLKRSSYLLVGKIPILPIFTFPLDSEFNRIIKRIFDIAFSLFIIIFFLSWIFPLVVLFIYISSPGNVFYTHKRIGINNLPFTCFKFRTMKVSDTSEPFQQTIKNDHRVFWFGKFLRKWNIDELPQFFNSLLGDISVVGPRPMMIGHIKEFDSEIKEMYSRHYIKPGITGLAQVMGYRGEIDGVQKMKGRIKMDRYYIQNWSFFLDFKIIWWTIRNTIFGDENAI